LVAGTELPHPSSGGDQHGELAVDLDDRHQPSLAQGIEEAPHLESLFAGLLLTRSLQGPSTDGLLQPPSLPFKRRR
jgi:hypothetical protein